MIISHKNSHVFKFIFIAVATIIIIFTTFFSNRLANALSIEERKKIETWAEATKMLNLISDNSQINFVLNILQANTTIPVILTDDKNNILEYRNIIIHQKDSTKLLNKKIIQFQKRHQPFILQVAENERQYIYYDDSALLKELYVFPYIQIGVIIIFILVSYFAFSGTKRAEQNRVWVGLSKETAHQLGTPISSLLAWTELLKAHYGEDKLITDMEKDVNRLRIIAERFSKIGSKPDLKQVNLFDTLENAVNYMKKRASSKVKITLHSFDNQNIEIKLNTPLFEWVIENLCKNAIDAMNGSGKIDIFVNNLDDKISIDVKDTGKGMERNMYKAVFSPGFTTKERGWGLGLSLAKRIIEEYHKGKIFVKQSEKNVGTTFRIILPKTK